MINNYDYIFSKHVILKKFLKNTLFHLFINKKSNLLVTFNFLISIFVFEMVIADTSNFIKPKNNLIKIEYLNSRNELEDYIIDTGDSIYLDFNQADQLSGIFPVNDEGELFLPRLKEVYVRGLTTYELEKLLEKRYAEFLINPDIQARIAVFKSIKILVRGELRNPGFYKFPAYRSLNYINSNNNDSSDNTFLMEQLQNNNDRFDSSSGANLENQFQGNLFVNKKASKNIIQISDLIRDAGGITSSTDLSRIEIIRDVPIGKGGGKKRAYIDFNSFVTSSDPTNDIRLFDGDSLFFPKLSKSNQNQVRKSILSGISPKFISVNLFGRVETPGVVTLPLQSALSDAIDLSGPIRPLSGKIVLIRYDQDGTVIKKNISYAAGAKRGSKRNPYLQEDDLITVKNSILGRTTQVIREFTAPFEGIYYTKELIDNFTN